MSQYCMVYIWIFRPITIFRPVRISRKLNQWYVIWITCHHWGGLTWLHDVTWGYTIGDEGWRFEVRCSSPSCLLMPGWKETNKMLVMQHWDCWIESAHRVTGTELKILKLLSSIIMYNWCKMLTDWLWSSFEAFSQRLENWIIKKENFFVETSLKVNREL